MKVLVAYATRHGATAGIAERIARALEKSGLSVDLKKIDDVRTTDGYDAFVIGSAAYYFHWLKEASTFVRNHKHEFEKRPVWLFSSGPLGDDKVDAEGHDILKGAVPREFAEFSQTLDARDKHVFFGAFDPDAEPVGLMERFTRLLPAVREALPSGDFRDWTEIETWARRIADEVRSTERRVPVRA
jgi:menaquinone-dependent protoporphyrinogen oxidase